jgi:two-component system phosphate regulon response regulator PhoB
MTPSSSSDVPILIIEDEADIREMVTHQLHNAGFDTFGAEDGQAGFTAAINHAPALILLDWMMPRMNGLDTLRRLKDDQRTADIPVIMLSAKTEPEHKSAGLDAGADDYLGKPFSPKELISRVKAVLRRSVPGKTGSTGNALSARNLTLDTDSHRVSINGEPIKVGPTEFKLLSFFLQHPERVYSREQILNHVWGSNVYLDERTIDVHIRRLRKALAIDGHEDMVQTVRGAGYLFSPNRDQSTT